MENELSREFSLAERFPHTWLIRTYILRYSSHIKMHLYLNDKKVKLVKELKVIKKFKLKLKYLKRCLLYTVYIVTSQLTRV